MSVSPESTTPTQIRPHGGVPSRARDHTVLVDENRPLRPHVPARAGLRARARGSSSPSATMIQPFERPNRNRRPTSRDHPRGSMSPRSTSLCGAGRRRERRPARRRELRLPAGYTYFGQFVDHDITFDPASSLTRQNDPDAPDRLPHAALRPRLALRRRPAISRTSTNGAARSATATAIRLLLEPQRRRDPTCASRNARRARALIGDPRNDENLIVSQLQVAFIKFHNAVVDHVAAGKGAQARRPLQAGPADRALALPVDRRPRLPSAPRRRRRTRRRRQARPEPRRRRHPPRDTYESPGRPGQRRTSEASSRLACVFYDWNEQPFMPVEFSVAAYRFGHSMARPSYLINDGLEGSGHRRRLRAGQTGSRMHANASRSSP